MQFLTTVITLFAMCGAALAGPVAEHGTLQDRSVPMFEYCDLDGGCSLDYDDNVNICETVNRHNSGVSTLVFRKFKCTLYQGHNCDEKSLVQASGQYDLPDDFRNNFRSYRCTRV